MEDDAESRPLLGGNNNNNPQQQEEIAKNQQRIYRNFFQMCLAFSLNHGSVVSCLAYASAELGNTLGGVGSGILYVCYALTAFLVAKPIVSMIGPRNGLILGVIGYSIYIVGFLIAVAIPWLAWPVFVIAAMIGGVAGGLLWPSQGRYFARNAKIYSDITNQPLDKVNSSFAGIFATAYLGMEMITKVLATVIFLILPDAADILVFILYSIIAIGCCFVMLQLDELDEKGSWDFSYETVKTNVLSTGKLLATDIRLALMLPFQITFGFTSSFVPYYVFGTVIADSTTLGTTYVGLLSALIVLSGSVTAIPAATLANLFGKPIIMTIGGMCLMWAGLIFYFKSNDTLGTWAYIVPYLILYGIGRGTWVRSNFKPHSSVSFFNIIFFYLF